MVWLGRRGKKVTMSETDCRKGRDEREEKDHDVHGKNPIPGATTLPCDYFVTTTVTM